MNRSIKTGFRRRAIRSESPGGSWNRLGPTHPRLKGSNLRFMEADTALLGRLGVALRELRRGTVQDLRSRLYGELIDLAQADALEAISHRGSCTMSELASELRVDASAATRTVKR